MPTDSSSSEMFGSKYQQNEQRWREQQKLKAKINDMKAKGLITPSDEFNGNPVSGKQFEYMSVPRSGMDSLSGAGDDVGSDLDLTVEKLFATTKKINKKVGAAKVTNGRDEKFQKFFHDDKYGITIHNDNTVDYVGTDFGSLMEFIQINTKSRAEYLTRKQLYDSDEFMPKFPENKRKYYVFKDQILDTDELTKASEEVTGKKKGTTLSLLERMNKITRATRAKKVPYTFKRKTFGTNQVQDELDEGEDEDQITEPYYEDPALQNEDRGAEEWKKNNDPKNVDNLVANLMKNHEQDLKDRKKLIKERTTIIKVQKERTKMFLCTTDKVTKETEYEHVILTKRTKYPPSTTTKKSRATKSKKTTKPKISTLSMKKLSKAITSNSRLLNNFSSITLEKIVTEKTMNSNNHIKRNESFNLEDYTSERVEKSTTNTKYLPKTVSISDKYYALKTTIESSIMPSTLSSLVKNFNNSRTVLSQFFDTNPKMTLHGAGISTNYNKLNLSALSITKLSTKLMTKSNTLKLSIPTFKKVIVKTIGIRKLTNKMKRKSTTKSKKS